MARQLDRGWTMIRKNLPKVCYTRHETSCQRAFHTLCWHWTFEPLFSLTMDPELHKHETVPNPVMIQSWQYQSLQLSILCQPYSPFDTFKLKLYLHGKIRHKTIVVKDRLKNIKALISSWAQDSNSKLPEYSLEFIMVYMETLGNKQESIH